MESRRARRHRCAMRGSLRSPRGFTLVESIMAIVIIGILGGMVAVFMKAPVDGYFDTVRRAALTDAADGALRRIGRDVRTALPNSVRGPTAGSTSCFEFLPTVGGGRYRAAVNSLGNGDVLDFAAADTGFDVIVGMNLPAFAAPAPTYHAVIYNLGVPGADAYEAIVGTTNRATIAATSTAAEIDLAANKFPFESPGRRFHVIENFATVYVISNGALMRQTRAIGAQMAACPATTRAACTPTSSCAILVGGADLTVTGNFSYAAAATERSGQLEMTLVLTQQGESLRLYHEMHVSNVP